VQDKKAEAQTELDYTWKKLAAPPQDENGNTAPMSPGTLRAAMASQREKYMPVSRWLRKLVERLEELEQVLLEAKTAAIEDAKAASRGNMGANKQREAEAEEAGNLRVQAALNENKEESVNSKNLMHTTKQYNLIKKLRTKLGFAEKAAAKETDASPSKGATDPDEETTLYGDWNKSILVSKKGKKIGSLGKMNKTFKEFRADPWERLAVVKAQK